MRLANVDTDSPLMSKRPAVPIQRVDRHCVFCGQAPESKSKEHILPQWLIRMTGDPKRKVVLGVNYGEARPIKLFSFDQFTFPACNACNNIYSYLEGNTRPIVAKMMAKEAISEIEIDILLDWLDKVRIGLWLGGRYLSNNFANVDPLFHISSRLARSDRSLFVTHTDAGNGLSVTGTLSLMFAWMPSVFGLRINDMLLLSASTDLMISKSLGFPFASRRWTGDGPEVGFEVQPGLEKVSPIEFGGRYRLPALKIFQPIYRKHLEGSMEQHGSDYVTRHSLDPLHGRGRVYVQSDVGGHWGGIEPDDHLCAELVMPVDLTVEFGAATLEAQNELIWTIPSERRLSPNKRGRTRKFRFAYAVNENDIAIQLAGRVARSEGDIEKINAAHESRFKARSSE